MLTLLTVLGLGVLLGAGVVVLLDEHVYQAGVEHGRLERDSYAFNVGWREGHRRGMRTGVQSAFTDLTGVRPANRKEQTR